LHEEWPGPSALFQTRDHALRVVELRAQPGVAMALGSATILSGEVPLLRRSLALDPRAGGTGASSSATSPSATTLPALAPRDGASFPVVQEMRGYRATAPVLLASIGVDF
jgi:hypothetical protein